MLYLKFHRAIRETTVLTVIMHPIEIKCHSFILYQDIHKGGLRMVDTEIMFKALKLAGFLDLCRQEIQNAKQSQITI